MDLSNLHFLRPLWLLLAAAGALLPWAWRLRHDPQRGWRAIIAPQLLDHLLVDARNARRWRPVHEIAIGLVLAGIAVAGPTWQRELPPFAGDQAPIMIAIDLSHTMDATDIAPTRLERAKQKVRDLMAQRRGARTGLVVYAGTAHLVVPPAADPAVMDLFLPALRTDLMPNAGRNSGAALKMADQYLRKEAEQAGTVVFIADDFDAAQLSAFTAQAPLPRQVLMLAVGTRAGGPLRKPDGGIDVAIGGEPLRAGFDRSHFETLNDRGVPVASLTLDDSDLRWIQRRAQHHLQQVHAARTDMQWKESGYYLCVPVALLALLWFRRGWIVQWAPWVLIVAIGVLSPRTAEAVELRPLDWFATADQQGRWYFERGEFKDAAMRFADARWKGLALYRAGDYGSALEQFAQRDDADAYFMVGNCHAQQHDYAEALAAYEQALRRQPDFPQAERNRALMKQLLVKPKSDDTEENPDIPPDAVKVDKKGESGGGEMQMSAQVLRKQSADVWMRNLSTSPAEFLRTKFAIQAGEQVQ